MQYLNDSNHFMAYTYIHEWNTRTRTNHSSLNYVISGIRHSISIEIESCWLPIDFWRVFRLCGMTCGELLR
jgi:hypothetical protein